MVLARCADAMAGGRAPHFRARDEADESLRVWKSQRAAAMYFSWWMAAIFCGENGVAMNTRSSSANALSTVSGAC